MENNHAYWSLTRLCIAINNNILDTLFKNKDLKSYTTHDNSGMTVCKLIFGDVDTIVDSTAERVIFNRKSTYQTKGDKARRDRYIRPVTRSQVNQQSESQDIDHARLEDSSLSVPGLSPVSVTGSVHAVFSPDTTPLCVDESPGIADCITEMDSSSSDDDVSVSHETTVDSIPSELEPDAEERLLEMCPGLKPDYKREIDRELFMEHFTHRSPKISCRHKMFEHHSQKS